MSDWCERIATLAASYDKDADKEWAITEQLKADLQSHRSPPRGLTLDLFNRILDWKLRRQRARTEQHRRKIDEPMLSTVTRCAIEVTHADQALLAAIRLKLLASLPGVGYGVASSIMTLVFPEQYGVIDFRVWKVIFNEDRTSFTLPQYLQYLDEVRKCSKHLGWEPQKVDFFTWKAYERPPPLHVP